MTDDVAQLLAKLKRASNSNRGMYVVTDDEFELYLDWMTEQMGAERVVYQVVTYCGMQLVTLSRLKHTLPKAGGQGDGVNVPGVTRGATHEPPAG